MAITLNGNTIEVNRIAGELGSEISNPFTFDDIYDANVDNEWGRIEKYETGYFFKNTAVKIMSGTYVVDASKYLWFQTPETIGLDIKGYLEVDNCTLYNSNRSSSVRASTGVAVFNNIDFVNWQYVGSNQLIAGNETFDNCSFKTLTYLYSGNVTTYNGGVMSGGNGLWIQGNGTVQNLKLINVVQGLFLDGRYAQTGEYTIKNVTIDTSENHLTYRLREYSPTFHIVDCKLNTSKRSVTVTAGYPLTTIISYFKTTFSADIVDSSGGNISIYDVSNNLVYDETLISDKMKTQEITYIKHHYEGDSGVLVKADIVSYQPFTLKVSKGGYQDLIISNINIVPGEPTIIRGEFIPVMVVPVYISSVTEKHCTDELTNDGSITIEIGGGTAPYEYSIDDGETWHESNIFENLTPGEYKIKVKDDIAEESETFVTNIIGPKINVEFITFSS